MSGTAIAAIIPILLIGACVGYWVHINTKKNKSE
jgi:hypothetical protein